MDLELVTIELVVSAIQASLAAMMIGEKMNVTIKLGCCSTPQLHTEAHPSPSKSHLELKPKVE